MGVCISAGFLITKKGMFPTQASRGATQIAMVRSHNLVLARKSLPCKRDEAEPRYRYRFALAQKLSLPCLVLQVLLLDLPTPLIADSPIYTVDSQCSDRSIFQFIKHLRFRTSPHDSHRLSMYRRLYGISDTRDLLGT